MVSCWVASSVSETWMKFVCSGAVSSEVSGSEVVCLRTAGSKTTGEGKVWVELVEASICGNLSKKT